MKQCFSVFMVPFITLTSKMFSKRRPCYFCNESLLQMRVQIIHVDNNYKKMAAQYIYFILAQRLCMCVAS